jgi:hypothetical protein
MVTALHMRKVHLLEAGEANIGPNPWAIPLPAGASLLSDELRKRQGDRGLSPRGPTVCFSGDSAGPRFDQEPFEVAVLRRRELTKAVNQAEATEPGIASSVRGPRQIQFEPPAGPNNWHLTGRIHWPAPSQGYGVAPICEWASDEGSRIWLAAQHRDLVVEFTDWAEGRRGGLAIRGRKFLAGIWRGEPHRGRPAAVEVAAAALDLAHHSDGPVKLPLILRRSRRLINLLFGWNTPINAAAR